FIQKKTEIGLCIAKTFPPVFPAPPGRYAGRTILMDLHNAFFGFRQVAAHHPPFHVPVHKAQLVFVNNFALYLVSIEKPCISIHTWQKGLIVMYKCYDHRTANWDKFLNKMTGLL